MAQLLFFGNLRDAAGGRDREMALPEGVANVADLVAAISSDDATLRTALNETRMRFVVNQKVVDPKTSIKDSDEIGFLPPFSGG